MTLKSHLELQSAMTRARPWRAGLTSPCWAVKGADQGVAKTLRLGGLAPDCIPVHSSDNHSGIAALKCRSCRKGRDAPPVHMNQLTLEREITPLRLGSSGRR